MATPNKPSPSPELNPEQAVDQAKMDYRAAELVQDFRKLTQNENVKPNDVYNLFRKHGAEVPDYTYVGNDADTVSRYQKQFASSVLIKEFDLSLRDSEKTTSAVDKATEASDIDSHVAQSKNTLHDAQITAGQITKPEGLFGFMEADELNEAGKKHLVRKARQFYQEFNDTPMASLPALMDHLLTGMEKGVRNSYTPKIYVIRMLGKEFGNPSYKDPIGKSIRETYAQTESQIMTEEREMRVAAKEAKAQAEKPVKHVRRRKGGKKRRNR